MIKYIIGIKDDKISLPTKLNSDKDEVETLYPIVGLSSPIYIDTDGELIVNKNDSKKTIEVKKGDVFCISQVDGRVIIFHSNDSEVNDYTNYVQELIEAQSISGETGNVNENQVQQ